jgi:peptide deformylase
MQKIFTLGDEILRQKAEPVAGLQARGPGRSFDEARWSGIAQEMLSALVEKKGVGLAGPQIGLTQRIFITNVPHDMPRVFINPSVIETSQDTAKGEEGCLSIPGVWADVIRPKTVKVQAWNEKGKAFVIEAGGILARVILHEYDHLEGKLFIDYLSEPKRNRILDKIARKAKA